MRLIRHIAVAFASSIALSACGGSGGHDDAPQVSLAVPSTSLSPIAETRATPPATTAASFAPSSSAEPMAFEGLSLSYLASFPSGSLAPALDRLGFGALQRGDTLVPGSDPAWRPVHGEIELAITRPIGYLGGLVASSLSATPVDFAIGSKVGLRATFIAPKGHHDADSIWAVVVTARTGTADDFGPTIRSGASLQIRGATARLTTPGGATPAGLPNLPQEVYDRIFDPTDPEPFTIELIINRVLGIATASLKVGEDVFTRTYEMAVFRADSGPAITVVGVALATVSGSGKQASVRVRDFRIFTPPS